MLISELIDAFWSEVSVECFPIDLELTDDGWDDDITHFDLGLRENASRYARQGVDDGIGWRPVPSVFKSHLRIQLSRMSFDYGSLANFIQQWDEKVFHIATNVGDEMQTPFPKFLKESLGDIVFIVRNLALQCGCHGVEGFMVIRIGGVILTAMTSPLLLMTMCSLKPKKLTHAALATIGNTLENLVSVDPLQNPGALDQSACCGRQRALWYPRIRCRFPPAKEIKHCVV